MLVGAVSPARAEPAVFSEVEFESRWQGLGQCAYLAPKGDFIGDDHGFDVVFHFHAGQMSERQMRESGLPAVFVSCGFGLGTGPYAQAFTDSARFDRMLSALVTQIEASTKHSGLHVRKLALASWSAGFAAVAKILAVPRYADMVDTVMLFDSLHAPYLEPNAHTAAQGEDHVDTKALGVFIRFAKRAVQGEKTMVVTHSSIVPPDYASSGEASRAMLSAIGVPTSPLEEKNALGMTTLYQANAGNLHVRGFRGRGPHDHFDHLHLIGDALRNWVVVRWKRESRVVYTMGGERR